MAERKHRWKRFIIPEFNRAFVIRFSLVLVFAVGLFSIFRVSMISGSSMEPTWHDGRITVVYRWRYAFSPPARGQVVTIRYFGRRYLLKRVLALPGDTVEFRQGKLFVNGEMQSEPYVKNPCFWNIGPVTVRPGHCYVAGDNREQDVLEHIHGEVPFERISGGPLF